MVETTKQITDTNKTNNQTDDKKNSSRIWTIRSYLFLLCLIVLSQSMISSGYIGAIVSSLERYYGFSTSRLGVAFSSYDITGVLAIPLISYFGSQNNRPRIVAFGACLFAIGNILFILPYFINGYSKDTSDNSSDEINNYLCQTNSSNQQIHSHDLCSRTSTSKILSHLTPNLMDNYVSTTTHNDQPTWTYYILILSMIIMSIGASPFYTLGITFLTDHLNKDDQAICTSILYGMVALGPALGFLMGSALLSQWINIGEKKIPNGITTNDPRWIGRWWAGFLVSASALTVFSCLLCTFPSKLSRDTTETTQEIDRSQSTESVCALGQAATRRHTLPKLSHPTQCKSLCQFSKIKDIFTSIIDLLMNFTYLLIVLINSVESILVVSFTTFMVKYIESVFNLSSSLSSTLTGSIVVPAAVFGTFTGGYLVRRFHMGILQCIKMILIACIISWLGLVALLFLKCHSTTVYHGDTSCSKTCHCSPHVYQPICYQEEITYLSPCHAGCSFLNGTDYSNCTCLSNSDAVRMGSCQNVCLTETFLFLLILFVVTFFQTLMATPQLIIILRSVQHELQSFGLGLENCIMKILAQIPAPILFGIIIDDQCLFWSQASCDRRGSCFIYNGDRLPLTLFGTAIIIKGISFTLLIVLLIVTVRRHKLLNNTAAVLSSTNIPLQEQQDPLMNCPS